MEDLDLPNGEPMRVVDDEGPITAPKRARGKLEHIGERLGLDRDLDETAEEKRLGPTVALSTEGVVDSDEEACLRAQGGDLAQETKHPSRSLDLASLGARPDDDARGIVGLVGGGNADGAKGADGNVRLDPVVIDTDEVRDLDLRCHLLPSVDRFALHRRLERSTELGALEIELRACELRSSGVESGDRRLELRFTKSEARIGGIRFVPVEHLPFTSRHVAPIPLEAQLHTGPLHLGARRVAREAVLSRIEAQDRLSLGENPARGEAIRHPDHPPRDLGRDPDLLRGPHGSLRRHAELRRS